LVHKAFVARWAGDYQDFFPVTLEQGRNVLLVALDNRGHGGFSGFFGFAPDAKYEVFEPGIRFIFSTETMQVEVGDTFTVHLSAENVTDFAGWQADIAFDPAVLAAVEVTEGDFLSEGEDANTFFQEGEINNKTGKITGLRALRLAQGRVGRQGTLLSVKFTAIASGESGVTLHNFQAGSRRGETIHAIPPEMPVVVAGEVPAVPVWDVNADGVVNIQDLVMVASKLGQMGEDDADVNGDGIVDIRDLVKVAAELGNQAAAPAAVQRPLEAMPTRAAVQQWLVQAQHLHLTDAILQRGIRFLEQLLATLTPKETALLPNYPNPFNPETWIPYHLAEPAEVTLRIYAASGALVRTLALGHQAAGIYQHRSRAAYWDGKNDMGEAVASGVYFYTFTAGDFTATGKMLIRK